MQFAAVAIVLLRSWFLFNMLVSVSYGFLPVWLGLLPLLFVLLLFPPEQPVLSSHVPPLPSQSAFGLRMSHLLPWLNPALTHSPLASMHFSLACFSAFCVSIPRITAPDVQSDAAVPNPAPIAAADADVCDRVSLWAFSMYVVISTPNQSGVHWNVSPE